MIANGGERSYGTEKLGYAFRETVRALLQENYGDRATLRRILDTEADYVGDDAGFAHDL